MELERKVAALFVLLLRCLSMQLFWEIWPRLLSGLFCELDMLSSALISRLTDLMKPRSKVEPGREEQRFPAIQKNEWKSERAHSCQTGNPLVPSWQQILVLATHTTDTSYKTIVAGHWWFQWSHSDWVSQPRHGHVIWGLSWEVDMMFLQWTTKQPALLLFYKTQMLLCYCWYILAKSDSENQDEG